MGPRGVEGQLYRPNTDSCLGSLGRKSLASLPPCALVREGYAREEGRESQIPQTGPGAKGVLGLGVCESLGLLDKGVHSM